MEEKTGLKGVYLPSEDVVARKLQEEFLIIPVTAKVGNAEYEIFSLNSFGQVIWEKLDGKKSLQSIVKELSAEFSATSAEIEKDVLGITQRLLQLKIIKKAKGK